MRSAQLITHHKIMRLWIGTTFASEVSITGGFRHVHRSYSPERFERAILLIRNQKVILDADIASLYGVTTKALKQAVKRNLARFPEDFMFQLEEDEVKKLELFLLESSIIPKGSSRSQIVTLKRGHNIKHRPYAFTEHRVAMLSSVLRSERAICVNIEIMRAFARLRQILSSHADLARKLDTLERNYDHQFKIVFDAIRQLMMPPPAATKKIGFDLTQSPSR